MSEGGVVEETGQAGAVWAAVGAAVAAVAFELLVEGVVEAVGEGGVVEGVGVALEEVSDAGEIGGGEFPAVLNELSGLLDERLVEEGDEASSFLFDEDALLDEDVVVGQEDLSLEVLMVFEECVSGLEGLLIGLEVPEVGW